MVFGRTTEPRFDPLVAVGAEQGGLAPWRDARDLWKQVKAWPVGGAACTRLPPLATRTSWEPSEEVDGGAQLLWGGQLPGPVALETFVLPRFDTSRSFQGTC